MKYTDISKLSGVEELRNPLNSAFEIGLCIEELQEGINSNSEWLDSLNTQIKISAESYNIHNNKSINEYVIESENYIVYASHRIELLKNEQLQYLN